MKRRTCAGHWSVIPLVSDGSGASHCQFWNRCNNYEYLSDSGSDGGRGAPRWLFKTGRFDFFKHTIVFAGLFAGQYLLLQQLCGGQDSYFYWPSSVSDSLFFTGNNSTGAVELESSVPEDVKPGLSARMFDDDGLCSMGEEKILWKKIKKGRASGLE